MSKQKITMQDIANACGFSRNTVSKVFNGRGNVPENTRRLILEKSRELGYRQFSLEETLSSTYAKSIALFSNHIPGRFHYGSRFVSGFTNRISRAGYTLMMYELQSEEIKQCRLPANFALQQTVGIICIEMFDKKYTEFVSRLGLPVIFSDTYAKADFSKMFGDVISMENTTSIMAVIDRLIRAGAKTFGFIGDSNHCNSFYERWNGFRTALARAGLPLDMNMCILEPDSSLYGNINWIISHLKDMPQLPNAFICANDYLAIRLMEALKKMEISIPDDVMVVGFDDSAEASVVDPKLSTVRIPSSDMGQIAASMLLERIQQPQLPFRCTYVQTTPIWRDTTLG